MKTKEELAELILNNIYGTGPYEADDDDGHPTWYGDIETFYNTAYLLAEIVLVESKKGE